MDANVTIMLHTVGPGLPISKVVHIKEIHEKAYQYMSKREFLDIVLEEADKFWNKEMRERITPTTRW